MTERATMKPAWRGRRAFGFGHRRRKDVRTAAALAAALISVTTFATAASATAGHKRQLTALQRGLAFYQGKTISFIAPTAAGSAYDIESRAVAVMMGQYLHATVNVENIPAGQTVPGQDDIAAAPPDGLTIGFFNTGSDYYDILTDQAGLNFNLEREAFLGGFPNTVPIIATQSSSPYPSFASLLHTTPATPVKVLITAGASSSEAYLLFKAFGINVQFLGGYPNSSALVQGFLRGDGNLIATGIAELDSEIAAGITRVLAVESVTMKAPKDMGDYDIVRSVPTVPELLQKYPQRTAAERKAAKYVILVQSVPNYVVGAPSATPPDRVAALDAAVKFAIKSAYVTGQVLKVGNLPGYQSPSQDKAVYVSASKLAPQIAAFLK